MKGDEKTDKWSPLLEPCPNYFPIAVIGIGCRLPGDCNNSEEFWQALKEGRSLIEDKPDDRWDHEHLYHPEKSRRGTNFVARHGVVKNTDQFDNEFFNISPREAGAMDQRQKQMIEVTYEAFQDSGYVPDQVEEDCAIYIGAGCFDHAIGVYNDTSTINEFTYTSTQRGMVATRIANALGLRGPAFVNDNACSAGMTCFHLACCALWGGEAQIAVAGGANYIGGEVNTAFCAFGVLSDDAFSGPMSAEAHGYVRSDGFTTLLLKPLDKAIADGDHVYMVAMASAFAQSGYTISVGMPRIEPQVFIMRTAFQRFGIPIDSIEYLEAHSTSTIVGDPIEAEALGNVFKHRDRPIKVGSVKSNLGHMEHASGPVAAIKIAMMVERNSIPPNINFKTPNPAIDFENWKLRMQTTQEPLPDKFYTISLNNFGIAGALAHCVFCPPPKQEMPTSNAGWQLGDSDVQGDLVAIPLSAKTEESLKMLMKKWAEYESETDALHVAGWQATRREHFQHRAVVLATSGKEFRESIEAHLSGKGTQNVVVCGDMDTVSHPCIQFTDDEGAIASEIGRSLYYQNNVFKTSVQKFDKIYQQLSGESLINDHLVFNGGKAAPASPSLADSRVAKSCLVVYQMAMVDLFAEWGVKPSAILGKGVGEIAAAYASKLIDEETGVLAVLVSQTNDDKYNKLIAERLAKEEGGLEGASYYSSQLGGKCGRNDLNVEHWSLNGNSKALYEKALDALGSEVKDPLFLTVSQYCRLGSDEGADLNTDGYKQTLKGVCGLYVNGADCNWTSLTKDSARWEQLPFYQWQHKKYLVEPERWFNRRLGLEDRSYSGQHGQLSLDMFHFLEDYTLDNEIVVPWATHVDYLLQMNRTEGQMLTLSDVTFTKNLQWPEDSPHVEAKKGSMKIDYEVEGINVSVKSGGETYCSAILEKGAAPSTPQIIDVDELVSGLRVVIDIEGELYEELFKNMGLRYGYGFKVLRNLWCGPKSSVASMFPVEGKKQAYQTILLDGCYQAAVALLPPGSPFYSPKSIGKFEIYTGAIPDKQDILVHCDMSEINGCFFKCNMTLLDWAGRVVAKVTDFHAENTTATLALVEESKLLHGLEWEPHGAMLPPTSAVCEIFEPEHLYRFFPEFMKQIDQAEKITADIAGVCQAYIRHALATVPVEERAAVKYYDRYIKRFEQIVADKSCKYIAYEDIDATCKHILEVCPAFYVETEMTQCVGHWLPQTMRDPSSTIHIIFDPANEERIFLESLLMRPVYAFAQELLERAVTHQLKHKKKIRVMELGGRLGGMTKEILTPLKHLLESGQLEYVFTDVHTMNFPGAQENLKEFPNIDYKLYTMDTPVEDNTIEPGSIDMIICINTVHASKFVDDSVAYMKGVLADNGWCCIIESTQWWYTADLWFDTLQVEWMHEDWRTERTDYVWAHIDEWCEVYRRAGFADIKYGTTPNEFGHTIFCARKPQLTETSLTERRGVVKLMDKQKPTWLITGPAEKVNVVKPVLDGCKVVECAHGDLVKQMKTLSGEGAEVNVVYYTDPAVQNVHSLYEVLTTAEEGGLVREVWVIVEDAEADKMNPQQCLTSGLARSMTNRLTETKLHLVNMADVNQSTLGALALLVNRDDNIVYEFKIEDGVVTVPRVSSLEGAVAAGTDDTWAGLLNPCTTGPQSHSETTVSVKTELVNISGHVQTCGSTDTGEVYQCVGVLSGGSADGLTTGDRVMAYSHTVGTEMDVEKTCVFKLSDVMTDEAALSVDAYVTAHVTLIAQAGLTSGETVLIQGATSPNGLAAIQQCREVGAHVICSENNTEKRKYLSDQFGVDCFVTSSSGLIGEEVMQVTRNRGVDLVYDVSQTKLSRKIFSAVKEFGKICVVGNRKSNDIQIQNGGSDNYDLITYQLEEWLRDDVDTIRGVVNEVMAKVETGKLRSLPATLFHVNDMNTAIEMTGVGVGSTALSIPQSANTTAETSVFAGDGTYMIIGGLGGLGRTIARWAGEKGARHIALVSRNDTMCGESVCVVDTLTQGGCKVYQYTADMSDQVEAEGVIAELKKDAPPLRGVIHAAGEQPRDNTTLTKDSITRIIDSKSTSALVISEITKQMSIDMFVLVSTVGTLWGNPDEPIETAANSVLNKLTEERMKEGLPSITIQLGPVKGAGSVDTNTEQLKALQDCGSKQVHVAQFLGLLERVIKQGSGSVAIANQSWGTVTAKYPRTQGLLTNVAQSGGGDEEEKSEDEIAETIKSKLCDLLCISVDSIDLNTPMIDYGVDSLTALELANWVAVNLNVTISQREILSGITTATLLQQAIGK